MLYRQSATPHIRMKLSPFKKSRKGGFTLIELMVVIAILATLGAIGYAPIMDHMNDGDRQMASSNLKTLSTIMQQFKTDNGSYPSDVTAEKLVESQPDYNFGELKGDYANNYFRQIYYTRSNNTEKNFYAKVNCAGKATKDADDKLANGRALERGENGLAYVMKKDSNDESVKAAVTASNAPLAMTSVYPADKPYAGDKVVYDNVSFRGHVFVLKGDGSVTDMKDDDLIEDENDDEKSTMRNDIFPETKRGRATANQYYVLSPEL